MAKFYVYLDVDGVLNSKGWFCQCKNEKLEDFGFSKNFDPKCINALNMLLNGIHEEGYYPQIVLSSIHKLHKEKTITNLLKYGLKYSGEFETTPDQKNHIRKYEIMMHMKEKEINNNYCIIDDECDFDIFPQERLIKTSFMQAGLENGHVKKFLNKLSQTQQAT